MIFKFTQKINYFLMSILVKKTIKNVIKIFLYSRLNLNKKNTVKKDSAKAKDTTSLIAKDATNKESDLSKLSSSNKNNHDRMLIARY